MVQRRAARWVKQDYRLTNSVSNMMEDLQWSTLCERRKYSRLTTFYKFLHQDPPDISIPRTLLTTLAKIRLKIYLIICECYDWSCRKQKRTLLGVLMRLAGALRVT